MKNKVAVVCFLWGEWPEDDPGLGRVYVQKLKSSVLRNTVMMFDWYEFGEYGIPFPEDFRSLRWNLKKMFMFSEGANLKDYEWVVALDLDMVITGSIDFLLQHRSQDLVTCRGAYVHHRPGGSVVAFDPNQLWTDTLVNHLKLHKDGIELATRGSERKYYHLMADVPGLIRIQYWQDLFPHKIVSYKIDGYKPGARIVRFHGKPRPHQVNEQWVKENWRC